LLSFLNISIGSIAKTLYFAKALDTRNAALGYVTEIGATKENTLYEGYTPFNPTGPATIFGGLEDSITTPMNQDLKYIILSSSMYSRFYAEPDKYGKEITIYEAIKANKTVLREFEPVMVSESSNDLKNIMNSLKNIAGYLSGGYSGPHLIFYEF
jgi:hypothetical protein